MCSCLNSLLFALILLSLVIFRSCLQVAEHPNNQSLVLLVIIKTYFVFVSTCTLRKALCIVLMDPRMRSLDGTHHITCTDMPAWEGQYSCPHAPQPRAAAVRARLAFCNLPSQKKLIFWCTQRWPVRQQPSCFSQVRHPKFHVEFLRNSWRKPSGGD